jgi:hypothetical protein
VGGGRGRAVERALGASARAGARVVAEGRYTTFIDHSADDPPSPVIWRVERDATVADSPPWTVPVIDPEGAVIYSSPANMACNRRRPALGGPSDLPQVGVGDVDQVRDQLGGALEAVGREAIAQTGQGAGEQDHDEIAEIRATRLQSVHRLDSARMTAGCRAQ